MHNESQSPYDRSCLLAITPASVIATPIQYFYQGPTLALPGGAVPAGVTDISGSFTVDLLPSLTNSNINYPLLEYSFFDGVTTYDSTAFEVANAIFFTNDVGLVTDFQLLLLNLSALVGEARVLQIFLEDISTPQLNPGTADTVGYCEEINILGNCSQVRFTPGNFGGPGGSLTRLISVPEPATLALLTLGFIGLFFARTK